MWDLDHEEGWAPKNGCLQTVGWRRLLESLLDAKQIKPVRPKGDQPWMFTGGTDAKAAAPTIWPPDARRWHIGKDPDAGKSWGQVEKGVTEDEISGCHHWLSGHALSSNSMVWAKSGRHWRSEEPGMLQSMGLQRVEHNLVTEQQQ